MQTSNKILINRQIVLSFNQLNFRSRIFRILFGSAARWINFVKLGRHSVICRFWNGPDAITIINVNHSTIIMHIYGCWIVRRNIASISAVTSAWRNWLIFLFFGMNVATLWDILDLFLTANYSLECDKRFSQSLFVDFYDKSSCLVTQWLSFRSMW